MREIAIKTMQRILYHQEHLIPFIPHRELLEEIIPNSTDLEWAVSDCENSWNKTRSSFGTGLLWLVRATCPAFNFDIAQYLTRLVLLLQKP